MAYDLKYITFSQMMASIESDFHAFADEGLIDRGKSIKIARRINEQLGLQIYREKEAVITIEDYKGTLPDEFYKLQLALVCSRPTYAHLAGEIFGTVTEEHNFSERVPVEVTQQYGNACINSCGGKFWVTQLYKNKLVRFAETHPIRLTRRSSISCSPDCPNLRMKNCEYELDIENGEVVVGFSQGKLYINYLADMVNEDGELIVLDHPLVRDYYEYAIKKHILENLWINSEADVAQKWQAIKQEYKEARNDSENFVNTVELSEIQKAVAANRMRFYTKYMAMMD